MLNTLTYAHKGITRNLLEATDRFIARLWRWDPRCMHMPKSSQTHQTASTNHVHFLYELFPNKPVFFFKYKATWFLK